MKKPEDGTDKEKIMRFKSLSDIMEIANEKKKAKKVAIAGADYHHVITASLMARRDGFADPVFVGNQEKIVQILEEFHEDPEKYPIIDVSEESAICYEAVQTIRRGEADFLMKGRVNTASLLKAVLNKETGLPHGKLMTQVSFFQIPGYHKLVVLSDGAILPYPTLEQKKEQIRLITEILHGMGYGDDIKVGILCAAENVSPKITETVEADELKQMNLRGEISGCIVEGPISLDIALSEEVAKEKHFESPVAGDADVLLAPSLAAGNLLAKALTLYGGAVSVGVVAGASVPISVTSRVATVEQKYCSLAVASMAVRRKE